MGDIFRESPIKNWFGPWFGSSAPFRTKFNFHEVINISLVAVREIGIVITAPISSLLYSLPLHTRSLLINCVRFISFFFPRWLLVVGGVRLARVSGEIGSNFCFFFFLMVTECEANIDIVFRKRSKSKNECDKVKRTITKLDIKVKLF